MKARHIATIALVLTGCHTSYPEGVYPCTMASDCPPMWSCHTNMHCYSTAEIADAGTDAPALPDAFANDAPMTDAPMIDTGPHCVIETCNGSDDDCDGLIDEGVMTVGAAVTVSTTAGVLGGTIVPLASGFGLIGVNSSDGSVFWITTDAAGAVVSRPSLGSDLPPTVEIEATPAGSQVVMTGEGFDGAGGQLRWIAGFDPTSGARTSGSPPFVLPFPTGEEAEGRANLVGASAGRVTLYAAHTAATTTGPQFLRRFRIDVSGATPRVIDARDVASDVWQGSSWTVLGTPDVDYILYERADQRIVLLAGPSGDGTAAFHTVGLVGAASPPRLDYASLAIRDPSQPVSSTNPLGLAWAGRAGIGSIPATVTFVEVTNTTVFAITSLVSFPDAFGSWGGFFTTNTISLVALPDAPEHWLLVNQDIDMTPATAGLVQVREILGAGSTVRRIPVPGESPAGRTDIGVAVVGGTIRLVEEGNAMGVVTRSIGCE